MPDDKAPRCDCGYEVIATDEAALLEEIRRHSREEHGIAFSVEDALLVFLRSQLDPSRDSTKAGPRTRRGPEGGSK